MNPKVAWTIFIIFIVIVLGVVGYFVYKYYQEVSKPVATVTPSASTTTNETADWKTYANTKYSYSIKYPSDWTYREYPDTKTGAGFRLESSPNDPQYEVISINEISRPGASKNLSFEDYVKVAASQEIQGYNSLASINKITTDTGVVGYKTTWNVQTLGSNSSSVSFPITYFDTQDGSGSTIQVTGNTDDSKNYLAIYNKMILTFQFTSSTADANWENGASQTMEKYFQIYKDAESKREGLSQTFKDKLDALKTSNYKLYIKCLEDFEKSYTDSHPGYAYINADLLDGGIQIFPTFYQIKTITKNNNTVIVSVESDDTLDTRKTLDYYLKEENGQWLIDDSSYLQSWRANDKQSNCKKN